MDIQINRVWIKSSWLLNNISNYSNKDDNLYPGGDNCYGALGHWFDIYVPIKGSKRQIAPYTYKTAKYLNCAAFHQENV